MPRTARTAVGLAVLACLFSAAAPAAAAGGAAPGGSADGPAAGGAGALPVVPDVVRDRPVTLAPGVGWARIDGARGSVLVDFGALPAGLGPARIDAAGAVRLARLSLPELARARLLAVRPAVVAGASRLGWAVDLVDPARLVAERVLVDGDGALAGRVPLSHAMGEARVYLRSPEDGETARVVLLGQLDPSRLAAGGLEVTGCLDGPGPVCAPGSIAASDTNGDWLFDPSPLDPADAFAEVQAYYQLEAAKRRLAADGLSAYLRPVHAMVNFRVDVDGDGVLDPYANALYFPAYFGDADGLLFGQAPGGDLAYDADVVHHELVHAATGAFVDLTSTFDETGYDEMPEVLAEGYADYFAATISGDPAIGPYAGEVLEGVPSLRRIDGGLACPVALEGEPHADSRIWSGALWAVREKLGDGFDVAVAAGVRALPNAPALSQAASVTRAATLVTLGEPAAKVVDEVFAARGVTGCERVVPVSPPARLEGRLIVTHQLGRMSPFSLQYEITVPPGATRLTVRLVRLEPGSGMLHLRVGSEVRYRRIDIGREPSYQVVDDASDPSEIVLARDTWPELEAGSHLFVSPANLDDHPWRFAVEVTTGTEVTVVGAASATMPGQGAEVPRGVPPVTGCACAPGEAGGSVGGAWPGLVLAIVALVAWRRRA